MTGGRDIVDVVPESSSGALRVACQRCVLVIKEARVGLRRRSGLCPCRCECGGHVFRLGSAALRELPTEWREKRLNEKRLG